MFLQDIAKIGKHTFLFLLRAYVTFARAERINRIVSKVIYLRLLFHREIKSDTQV